jgi:hypothetical protein
MKKFVFILYLKLFDNAKQYRSVTFYGKRKGGTKISTMA